MINSYIYKMLAIHYFSLYFNKFIIIVLFIIDAAVSLRSSPGLMRYHKGDDVTFIWTFTDKLETIFTIEITYNTDIIVKRLANGQVSIDGKYKGRVTFEELDKSIKFILKDVSDDDVIYGVYKLSFVFVVGGTSSSLNDNKAELYLFGK